MIATIYRNIFETNTPHYLSIEELLLRIKEGRSKQRVQEIRNTLDKSKKDSLKKNLPSVVFSGKYKNREDNKCLEYSGFMILDFDKVEDLEKKKKEISEKDFIYACWLSPSGDGLKALVKIKDPKKHREHFKAIETEITGIDQSGVNESRVCFESYDTEIYINKNAKEYSKILKIEKEKIDKKTTEYDVVFKKIMIWISNKGEVFAEGNRNGFVFKLASACCRFGIPESISENYILSEVYTSNEFSKREATLAIKSAYKRSVFGSAEFTNDVLVDKVTKQEVIVEREVIFDINEKAKDVIYAIDVKEDFRSLYYNGYENLKGIDVPQIDYHFKAKRGELTLMSGFGNMGKSTYFNWYIFMRILLYGEKFAVFSPESNPSHEYYMEFVEMYLGCDCSARNHNRPKYEIVERVYDYIGKHLFYVYPEELAPTPEYIKEKFLELIIKEKVDGCVIDPFNQLANDYEKNRGRDDRYLDTFLSDCKRFATLNDIFFFIIAHPKAGEKTGTKDYACPDVFQLAGGSMWNNKCDNILMYHRPFGFSAPSDPTFEFHSKKIKKQKVVGKKGMMSGEYILEKRRYIVNDTDYMQKVIEKREEELKPKQKDINFTTPKKDIARNIEINDDFFLDDEGFTPISESEEAPF
jgi:hypothetical protein